MSSSPTISPFLKIGMTISDFTFGLHERYFVSFETSCTINVFLSSAARALRKSSASYGSIFNGPFKLVVGAPHHFLRSCAASCIRI